MPEQKQNWKNKIVTPEKILSKIKPGMKIFLGTGNAEPRTLIKALQASQNSNLQDLELIQLVSLGDAVPLEEKYLNKYRLKTFFAGSVGEALREGKVDLIPSRFSRIPRLIESGGIRIDAAFLQITPPDSSGFSSFGPAIDVARLAMEKASLIVGEINKDLPRTLGDTFVNIDDFDFVVHGTEPPINMSRWTVDDVYEKIGINVALVVQDKSCLSFGIGPLYESLAKHLTGKKDLGIVTPIFTDALMDLVKSGAITNRFKGSFRGKSLISYAVGTTQLMKWLDQNPLMEFQPIDVVSDPMRLVKNDRFTVILPARKIDLTGGVALHTGRGNVAAGPGESREFFNGAALSQGGRAIFALPSRNLKGESNIILTIRNFPNQINRESIDLVVTEYGVSSIAGRTVRERALSLIDIAHPDDRDMLVQQAKTRHLLYQSQKYFSESSRHYPQELTHDHTFQNDLTVRFRAIRPSDVDDMRRLFYGFSDSAVYYRYFSPIKTMPHTKMQDYVNIDYNQIMSIVGITGDPGENRLIAEARYAKLPDESFADIAFIVDESCAGKGIASYMFHLLVEMAIQRGLKGFKADVLTQNKAMMKVFEKASYPIKALMHSGVYELTIPFEKNEAQP